MAKPGARRNATDDDYWWPMLTSGFASSTVGAVDEKPDVAAVLWVPDPEQRHGWREYYVNRDTSPPAPRTLGFRRRA